MGGDNGAFYSLPSDEAGAIPDGNYKYTTEVEAGRKGVERDVKRESILTGDSG
jgi:hypothetical protein